MATMDIKDFTTGVASTVNKLPLGAAAKAAAVPVSIATDDPVFKAEDAAHVSGDLGIQSLAVRKDTAVSTAADGDYVPLLTDSTGQLWVQIGKISGVVPAFGSGAAGSTVLRTVSATDDPIVSAITTGVASSLPAGEAVIGKALGYTAQRTFTFSLDTSAYASGDLLADTQQIDAFFRVSDGTGVIQSLTLYDQDDQGVAMTVYFHSTSSSMGTENSAPSINDANSLGILGWVDIATTDWKDLGGVRVACIKNIGLPVKAVSGTDDLYISAVNSTGTPTFTASGVKGSIGVLLD